MDEQASGLPFLFAIPALLWLFIWWIRAGFNDGNWFPRAADGRIVFGQVFYGDYTIDPIFMITFFGPASSSTRACASSGACSSLKAA